MKESFTVINTCLNNRISPFIPEFAFRTCGVHGKWEGQIPGDYSAQEGWTNYLDCYTPKSLDLYKKFFSNSSAEVCACNEKN